MRICVFQSCFEELQASVGEAQELCMNPGVFTSQHMVAHKTIHKATAKAQIDEAVQEGYDFYLNFMWGTHDDSLAGVDAIRYFESLNLPSAGVQSSERAQSKWDFFADAKLAGKPLIPGTETYPLFVKPASSYGSMFIDEHSLCQNEAELESCIIRLNKSMRPVRLQRAQALGHLDTVQYADSREKEGRESTDIVVQEFIAGEEYSVVVIAMGETPVPLIPQRAKYKQVGDAARILTLELKFDAESGYELLSESDDPALWKHLQETAIEAFTTRKMYTNFMGCDVDMRIGNDGRAYVIEVDPLPVFFYPTGSQLEDTDVKYGFPGGYRAVINTYITNYFLKHSGDRDRCYHELATILDNLPFNSDRPMDELADITALGPWNGTVIDLGCGRGNLGRALKADPRNNIPHLVGVDISKKALEEHCENSGYDEVVNDRMELFLAKQTERVDHIFCISTLQFLTIEELDFVLARCFQLAKRSITIVIQVSETSARYDPDTRGSLNPFFTDHSENIATFQIQRGWELRMPVKSDHCHDVHRLLFNFSATT
ncbi:uncharacterized protein N7483_012345 [Penicillium malachiteum]|uniref:uncharacterized protein n=1 Tax=Penicillium malachiteum TaxID=1324776 RepID=UPI0025478EE7|nr:uncharacterized protein N7483_012345 [Penicillium malachiteum]KAJ5715164.1 hypothetical protein N7483_012345 [Penicillium malachiteum]